MWIYVAGGAVAMAVLIILVLNLSTGEKKVTKPMPGLYGIEDPQFMRTMGSLFSVERIPGDDGALRYRLYGSLFYGATAKIDPIVQAVESGPAGAAVVLDALQMVHLDTSGLDAPPSADLVMFDPDEIAQVVEESIGTSAMFASRFRECAARALLLPRRDPRRRQPLWQQRQRAAQLTLAA